MRPISARESNPRVFASALHQLSRRYWGRVTLTAGATTTLVELTAQMVNPESAIFFDPLTDSAKTALASMIVYEADRLKGRFTITHANVPDVDQDFIYVILGN